MNSMKKILLTALVVLGMSAISTDVDAQFSVIKDGKVILHMAEGTPDYVTFENVLPCGGVVGEAVDLGLSVKWSSVNVGATNPQDAGSYYAWGETESKDDYSWSTYALMRRDKSECTKKDICKYQLRDNQYDGVWYDNSNYNNNGGKTVLAKKDDVASVVFGGDWVIPTKSDWKELKDNTNISWKDDYNGTGVSGYVLTSKKDAEKSIFLPAAGLMENADNWNKNVRGYYLTSTLAQDGSSYAKNVVFSEDFFNDDNDCSRFIGESVRPVCYTNGETKVDTNGHTTVDLGLPSGNLWSTCNVGASSPEGYGSFYAWGEVFAKTTYSAAAYTVEVFIGDNETILGAEDDAATQNWGSEWRMPTIKEWEELIQNTTYEKVSNYKDSGVDGYVFTGKGEYNNASIFLPFVGERSGTNLSENGCHYWSSSLGDDTYSACRVNEYFNTYSFSSREYGKPVRPVCAAKK